MNRDVVLVTGGNSGIGFECARQLARQGWHVPSRAAIVRLRCRPCGKSLRRAGPRQPPNLASTLVLSPVRAFVKEIERQDLPLRALVCNAGLQIIKGPQFSLDGFECTVAVNHLGHFLLTNLLLTRLIAKAPARIVIVSSGVHDPKRKTGMPKPAVTDMQTLITTGGPRKGEFEGRLAYVNSKLCNLWLAYELVRRIETAHVLEDGQRLTVNGFDPGLVPGSGLARDYSPALRFIWDRVLPGIARVLTLVVPHVSTARKSGHALARLVLDPTLVGVSGKYFPSHTRWQAAPSSDASYDLEQARALWEESVRVTGLAPKESPLVRR